MLFAGSGANLRTCPYFSYHMLFFSERAALGFLNAGDDRDQGTFALLFLAFSVFPDGVSHSHSVWRPRPVAAMARGFATIVGWGSWRATANQRRMAREAPSNHPPKYQKRDMTGTATALRGTRPEFEVTGGLEVGTHSDWPSATEGNFSSIKQPRGSAPGSRPRGSVWGRCEGVEKLEDPER